MQATPVLPDDLVSLKVVPVVTIDDPTQAVPMALALKEGGLPAAEVTLRTPESLEAIRAIATQMPDFLVGAGTVLTPEQAKAATEAGAQFVVSPGFDAATVAWCQEAGVPVIPGVATPSEVMQAKALGLELVKLFPASVLGGPAMLKALAGPFGDMRFMCTGGVRPENLTTYLAEPNVACVGGTWLTPKCASTCTDWTPTVQACKEAVQLARAVRA